MKLNPDQWLILDKDDTIHGKPDAGPRECRPGLGEFLERQRVQRNVAVYSIASLDAINEHLGGNIRHLDRTFSQDEPIMSNTRTVLSEGRLYPLSEVAEITEASIARLRAAKELVLERDHSTLADQLRISFFTYELLKIYGCNEITTEGIERLMASYEGDPSGVYFHFPFNPDTSLTPELEKEIRTCLDQTLRTCFDHQTQRLDLHRFSLSVAPILDPLREHRKRTGFEEVLDAYYDQRDTQWTFKGTGLLVTEEDYYLNPNTQSRQPSKKDLHRLRLRLVQEEGANEAAKMIMVEDWAGFRNQIHESDPRTPVLIVNPEDKAWIQRGAIEGLIERLFQYPEGPDHGFRHMLSVANELRSRSFARTCSLVSDGHHFIFAEGPKKGLIAFEASPQNLHQFRIL